MKQKDEISDLIRELRHAAHIAQINYNIWWVYKEKDSRKQYVYAMNYYVTFFRASIHAHFVAYIIALYRIFETRKDTANFEGLLRLLLSRNKIAPCKLAAWNKRWKQKMKPTWIKISILRNKGFAHRSKYTDMNSVFTEASVTPNEVSAFIQDTKHLLNEISSEWDGSVHAFNIEGAGDLKSLLNDLKFLQSLRNTEVLKE